MKTINKLLLDIIPVVFGVLIALFISGWKQSYDDQQFLDKMYATINQEMEGNVESLTEVLTKHYAFIDSTTAYMEDEDVSIAEILQMNFQVANIQNTGWRAFTNSRLELVDFEVMATLTSLDDSKHNLNLKFEKLMDFIVNNLNSKKREDKMTMLVLVMNLVDSEEALIRIHRRYLEWYDSES